MRFSAVALCGKPVSVEYGIVEWNDFGREAKHSCCSKQSAGGNAIQKCTDGQWSPKQPITCDCKINIMRNDVFYLYLIIIFIKYC